jgi:photosystem II stability/assembly factor-like uncharacterized protein
LVLALSALAVSTAVTAPLSAQTLSDLPDDVFDRLEYRHIGPVGNRVSAVVGVPGDPNVYFFGAASGGVWKSTDGGVHWDPVFDDQPAQSVGAIAIAPSDPNVVWVGTGEAHIRSNVSIGNGVYRSTDGGRTWSHMGLEMTGRISRIRIHPRDPDLVYVAALGHLYGPQQERGVYRSRDGGETWERVLFAGENAGASDLIMDPNNPRILFAGTWQMEIRTWGRWSGGPESGLWMTRDEGDSWERLEGNGLPTGNWGKIGLAMSRNDSDRVYALIETNSNRDFEPLDEFQGVLWRSDDGGRTWDMVNPTNALTQRPLYYTRAVAAPDDRDEVHFLATAHTRSTDGGLTVSRMASGGDHHDMWIDPLLPDRMIVGHDQGLSISTNRGDTWMRPRLPVAQMYHGFTDNRVPYRVYGNRQDGASQSGPSNSLTSGRIPIGAWHSVGGCESGFAVPDTVGNDVVWSGCYDGILERYEMSTGHARNVSVWPDNPEGWPAAEVRYRFQWTFPVHVSPHDPGRVYVGSQHVHLTTNGGQSWTVMSPDLTTDDETKQQKTGGLTPDDSSPTYAATLFAIAESPVEEGVIWAGSNDGLLHVTRDGGEAWTDVTENIPDLPPWGTFSNIEPSVYEAGTAYVSVDLHQLGDFNPYVYKTEDYGLTWRSLAEDLPRSVFSYVHVIREDPRRRGLLYLGMENGVFASFDDGSSWRSIQGDLPHAPVHWLTVQPHFNDLVVSTYGRGFWILDDVTPMQQLDHDVLGRDLHLFEPRAAYRFLMKESPQSQPEDPGAGENPKYGASLNLWLASVPEDELTVEILDTDGEVIRTLSPEPPLAPGLNRVHWDLRHESSNTPRLRVPPLERSHVQTDEDGWRPLGEGGRVRPLAAPGRYTVRVTHGDDVVERELTVVQDPSSVGSQEDIEAQLALLLDIRAATDSTVSLINHIELVREQLAALAVRLENRPEAEGLLPAAEALDQELIDLEMMLFDLRLSGGLSRQDALRWPRRLYAKLTSLAGYVSGTDHRPTDQHMEVFEQYRTQLEDYWSTLRRLEAEDLADLNEQLRERGVGPVAPK